MGSNPTGTAMEVGLLSLVKHGEQALSAFAMGRLSARTETTLGNASELAATMGRVRSVEDPTESVSRPHEGRDCSQTSEVGHFKPSLERERKVGGHDAPRRRPPAPGDETSRQVLWEAIHATYGGVVEGIDPKQQACSALSRGLCQAGRVGVGPTSDEF